MGAIYGQRTRFLLNHDTVFLAELLMEHAGQPEWGAAYRKRNCMAMPKGEMPLALQFAAAATVTLAHFRIADHCEDSRSRVWGMAGRFFGSSFERASGELKKWKFPLDELARILASQSAREARPESLAHVAEPTALATAMFFEHGFGLVGRPDLQEAMREVGYRFGFLIYTLDAYEDAAKDARSGDFNPLHVFSEIDAPREILSAAREIALSLPPGLGARLRVNVEERLGMRTRVPVLTWQPAILAFAGIGVPPPPPTPTPIQPQPPLKAAKPQSSCCNVECCCCDSDCDVCCDGACCACECL